LLRVGFAVLAVCALLGATGRPALAGSTAPQTKQRHRVFLPIAVSNPTALRGHGVLPPPGQQQIYVLQEGDNLTDLAVDLGRDVATMACVTPSGTYPLSMLRPGQEVVIPAPEYLCHTVLPDETVASIAARYQVDPDVLTALPWNELNGADAALQPGRRLLIFGGVRPEVVRPAAAAPTPQPTPTLAPTAAPTPPAQQTTAAVAPTAEIWPFGDGQFIWPVQGEISQDYHARHRGLDIATAFGREVVAADNGVVVKAGWSDAGYGLRVVIDHNIDYITLYAHLSEIYVEEGQVIEKGQVIGRIGSTGNSTGPHLHFELRDFGYLIDPLRLLNGDQ
jgi:murein DD-endopeptidase MepM/ murein hydrolase activator NlpD